MNTKETNIYINPKIIPSTISRINTRSIIENILVGRKYKTPFYKRDEVGMGYGATYYHNNKFLSFSKSEIKIFLGTNRLNIPENMAQKISKYLEDIEKNDMNNNCKIFASYITGNDLKDIDGAQRESITDKSNIQPGDIIFITDCPKGEKERGNWHYYIYLGKNICIGKNGHGNTSSISFEKVDFTGMYKIKLPINK